MIDRPIRSDQVTQVSGAPTAVRYILPQSSTSLAERFLLLMVMIIFPLSNTIPTVAGMSILFLIYGVLAAYTIVNRTRALGEIWCHPVFIAAYAFIGVCALLEFSSPLSSYDELLRFTQMIGGAVCVAALCRDRSALTACLYGYIVAALWLSLYLYLSSYGTLQEAGGAGSFHQASKIRATAFADLGLQANLNGLAFTCTQGAVVAFALGLSIRSSHRRILLLGIATFCLVASFLPMSRGAAVGGLVSFGAILYAQGVRQGKTLILVSVLALGMYALIPDAVWSRMAFSTESRSDGKMEARAWIYTTALNRLPEYVVAGVGAGNYRDKWGFEKGFAKTFQGVLVVYGAHNSILQITIFWGAFGLSAYLLIIWCVYRSVPLRCARDELSLALLGIIVSLGAYLFLTHGFYEKSFAFGVGIVVGARRWIWPAGIVSAVEVNQGSSRAQI
jgi:hypothetical protein